MFGKSVRKRVAIEPGCVRKNTKRGDRRSVNPLRNLIFAVVRRVLCIGPRVEEL